MLTFHGYLNFDVVFGEGVPKGQVGLLPLQMRPLDSKSQAEILCRIKGGCPEGMGGVGCIILAIFQRSTGVCPGRFVRRPFRITDLFS